MDIGSMVGQAADRFGDRLAVACQSDGETRTRTFDELNAESNQIANGLLDIGIGTGDVVSIYAQNSIEFVETFFAAQNSVRSSCRSTSGWTHPTWSTFSRTPPHRVFSPIRRFSGANRQKRYSQPTTPALYVR
ncbi:hypothetical protein D8S78_23240 [Natrialba swarupiae]|nr:hypothetical protein [Natrialba swarupiae]